MDDSDESQARGPWRRKVTERHLDLMLAEDLSCRPSFARWFVERCEPGIELPSGDPTTIDVRISEVEDAGDGESAGENDLVLEVGWEDGTTGCVLIEDKLDAALQPRQAERYGLRLEQRRKAFVFAVGAVVAPEAYLRAKHAELAPLVPISIESIADRLRIESDAEEGELRTRLRWRADHLVQLKEARRTFTPSHEPTVALSDWLISRIQELVPHTRLTGMRTINETWLYFVDPKAMIYKVQHGRVDIYRKYMTTERPGAADSEWPEPLPEGFEPLTDDPGNEILRCVVHEPVVVGDLWHGDGPRSRDDLLRGVEACARAVRWLDEV